MSAGYDTENVQSNGMVGKNLLESHNRWDIMMPIRNEIQVVNRIQFSRCSEDSKENIVYDLIL